MKKYIVFIFFLILAALITAGYFFFHTNSAPVAPSPQNTISTTIEEYVAKNISDLSPVKEQLGGTFYVTQIETHNGAGIVHYEDGHSAYTADFSYTASTSGEPSITSFIIRAD